MKRENDINKKISLTIISISVLIILIQFTDSYCTEIFGRTQSLSVKEFLMDARGMGADEGVAYMSRMMLPFYLIGMLTPFVRSYADIVGRKVMLAFNVALLAIGSVICMLADSLMLYLLGNGILILGYSLDVHMIYIVDMLPADKRATVRGICGGAAMAAAMCISLFRSLVVGESGYGWQRLFLVGIIGGAICLALVLIYRMPESEKGTKEIRIDTKYDTKHESKHDSKDGSDDKFCQVQSNEEQAGIDDGQVQSNAGQAGPDDGHIHFIRTMRNIWQQTETRRMLIGISVVGIATAGITYYNEPMCAFSGMGEKSVNMVLFIQPLTALVINVLIGILADRIHRMYVVRIGIVLSLVSGIAFTAGVGHTDSVLLIGILWGCMYGFYFSAEELINMMVMESVDSSVRGRASALSTFAYGIGDQLGIFAISLVVGALGMKWAKMIFLVPLVFAVILFMKNRCKADDSGSSLTHDGI